MYLHVQIGDSPILITVPHDGWIKIPGAPIREEECKRDLGTLALALRCSEALQTLGQQPTIIWQSLHRRHVDVNRYPHDQPYAMGFEDVYLAFHDRMDDEIKRILDKHSTIIHLDIHGFLGPPEWDLILGTHEHATSPRGIDIALAAGMNSRFSKILQRNYRVTFSPDKKNGIDHRYSGRWIVGRCGQQWGKRIDSIQCEFNRHMRQPLMTDELAEHLTETLAQLI